MIVEKHPDSQLFCWPLPNQQFNILRINSYKNEMNRYERRKQRESLSKSKEYGKRKWFSIDHLNCCCHCRLSSHSYIIISLFKAFIDLSISFYSQNNLTFQRSLTNEKKLFIKYFLYILYRFFVVCFAYQLVCDVTLKICE